MRLCVGLLLTLLVSSHGRAQAPAATPAPVPEITVSARVVSISATVRDQNGLNVTGLRKDDFLLKQDGKPQPIRYFSQAADLPLTIALLVDTSGSQRSFLSDERTASDLFFRTVLGRPQDRATLLQFNTQVVQLTPLTGSVPVLRTALGHLRLPSADVPGTELRDAVFAAATVVLPRQSGRKAIILLTDGDDEGSHHSLDETIAQAQRGNIQIFSILYTQGEAGTPANLHFGLPELGRPAEDTGPEVLQKLSLATGGRAFEVSRKLPLAEIFAQIRDALNLQYEIGYTPPPDTRANSRHRLELRTTDRQFIVDARTAFFAP